MKIHLWLNGKEISDEISPDMPLLEYVRTKGCYSVKRGCETSNCGLCTVWMNKKPVLSCSVLAARADGKEIVTLEGVQERAAEFGTYLANQGGEQCGFCNPGFIMNVLAMEDELNNPTEEEIKARFLDAFNTLVSDKERLLDECRTMQAALTDTGSLDSEIAALLSEMEVVAELTKRCIEENSTTAQDQAAYLERYNGLAERYETAKAKLEKLQATKAQREAKSEDIGGFMFELAEYGDSITEFDDRLWLTVIDTVTVHRDGRLTFKFQTGHEITV